MPESKSDVVLEISKVYKSFEDLEVLKGISMEVKRGEVVAVIGPSGGGKSTLLRCATTLEKVDNGKIVIGGDVLCEDGTYCDKKLEKQIRSKFGLVFQNFNLISNMTVEENIELPLIYRGMKRSERVEKVKEAVAAVGLQSRVHHLPTELSGGQQQRVAIARAIVTKPSLILADEPTGNLDSHTSRDIIEIFKKLNALGNTILLITHDPDVAAEAKRVVRIKDGKISEVTKQ